MAEPLGQVLLQAGARLWIMLQERQGPPEVELRVGGDLAPTEAETGRARPGIRLPVDVLPILVGVLTHAQDRLIEAGHLSLLPPAEATVMERGVPVKRALDNRPARRDERTHPRVPVALPIECRVLDPQRFWPARPLAGTVTNLSLGGAQVWLPQRVPLFAQVEITLVASGTLFRGRAQVVGIDLPTKRDPHTGQHRHSLRWLALEGPAQAVLAQLVGSGDSPAGQPRTSAEKAVRR